MWVVCRGVRVGGEGRRGEGREGGDMAGDMGGESGEWRQERRGEVLAVCAASLCRLWRMVLGHLAKRNKA